MFMTHNADDYFICVNADRTPVGFVGVVCNDIRIAVHPDHQGRGYARYMLETIKVVYPEAHAKIFVKNIASRKLFESVGIPITLIPDKE
jgi:GNAT superfamily N-acetyltransferase